MNASFDSDLIIKDEDRDIILAYLTHNLPFFLEGSPGIGKSLAARVLGKQVYSERNIPPPIKIDITEDTEVRHLLGEIDFIRYFLDANTGSAKEIENYFNPGPLVQAMINGQLLIIEELDRAGRETLFPVLFDAIEYKKTYIPEQKREIYAAPTFNVIITVNRSTDLGTVRLPAALLRRLRRVGLYDPTQFGYDNPTNTENDQPEARQMAYDFEKQIILCNLAHELSKRFAFTQIGAEEQSLEKCLQQALGQDSFKRISDLLNFIYVLRGEIIRSQSGWNGDRITPAEASRFICDIFTCDSDVICSKQAFDLFTLIQKHIGALAKTEEQEILISGILGHRYIEKLPPFD